MRARGEREVRELGRVEAERRRERRRGGGGRDAAAGRERAEAAAAAAAASTPNEEEGEEDDGDSGGVCGAARRVVAGCGLLLRRSTAMQADFARLLLPETLKAAEARDASVLAASEELSQIVQAATAWQARRKTLAESSATMAAFEAGYAAQIEAARAELAALQGQEDAEEDLERHRHSRSVGPTVGPSSSRGSRRMMALPVEPAPAESGAS